MSTYSNRLQPALQNLLQRVVRFFHPRSSCTTHLSADVCGGRKSRVKPETWQNISSCSVLSPRLSCTTTHISADVQRITLTASCMMILGRRTEQLDIFYHVTGFTSDFLRFIDVELIRFFHGALQLFMAVSSREAVLKIGKNSLPLQSSSKLTDDATATAALVSLRRITGVLQYIHSSVEVLLTEVTLQQQISECIATHKPQFGDH